MTRRGFTLVELLVVMGVIAILASMAMPVLAIASRAAKQSATRAVMHKVDTALRLFKGEVGAYPWQLTYADTAAGERPDNRLGYHLGTTIALTDLAALHADADAAAAQYTYDCSNGTEHPAERPPVSPHVFLMSDIQPSPATMGDEPGWRYQEVGGVWQWVPHSGDNTARMGTAVMLNRMATERARLAIFSGNIGITGCRIRDAHWPTGGVYATGRDLSNLPLLAAPQSAARPGFAGDYLRGEIEPRFLAGHTILDAWRRPLIYVGQVTEGMRGARSIIFHSGIRWIDARQYGLDKQGRGTLAPIDPFTGAALTADGARLPDPNRLFDSDRRTWAAPGLEHDIELWSAGPSGRFDWMRSHPDNVDSIGLQPYDRSIPR